MYHASRGGRGGGADEPIRSPVSKGCRGSPSTVPRGRHFFLVKLETVAPGGRRGGEREERGWYSIVCFLALTTHPFRGHEQLTEEKSTAIPTKRGWLLLSLVLCCCQDATLLLLFVSKMLRCCCSRCDEGIESTHLSIYLYTIANTAITICDFFPCQSTAILLCTPMGAMRDDSPRK